MLRATPLNTILTVDFTGESGVANNPTIVTGAGWDLNQVAGIDPGGASWLSEMTIAFDWEKDGINDIFLTPSATGAPGSESTSSGGILVFADLAIPDGVLADNSFNIEFFESFVDDPATAEGFFDVGSTLTFRASQGS